MLVKFDTICGMIWIEPTNQSSTEMRKMAAGGYKAVLKVSRKADEVILYQGDDEAMARNAAEYNASLINVELERDFQTWRTTMTKVEKVEPASAESTTTLEV